MAVASVFALPELHEAILSHTDMVTLLVSAQRVSKAWRALIAASPTLQRKLFFQPVPGDAHPKTALPVLGQQRTEDQDEGEALVLQSTTTEDGTGSKATEPLPSLTRNPLLVKYFSPCFFETHSTAAYFRQANSFMALPWTPNPRREKLDEDGIMRSIPVDPPEDAYVQYFRERFFRRGASWRRMLVTQPPLCQLGYLSSQEKLDGLLFSGNWTILINSTIIPIEASSPMSRGLRMGTLYDFVQERACHHDLHNLWFRLHWEAIREPAYCDDSEAAARRLVAQSRVVVEILEQQFPNINAKKPPCSSVFDDVFRCDEHEPLQVVFADDGLTTSISSLPGHLRGMLSSFAAVHDASDLLC